MLDNCQLHEVQQEQVLDSTPGMRQPWLNTQTGKERLESSPMEKDLGVLVHFVVDVSQCALAAKRTKSMYPEVHQALS